MARKKNKDLLEVNHVPASAWKPVTMPPTGGTMTVDGKTYSIRGRDWTPERSALAAMELGDTLLFPIEDTAGIRVIVSELSQADRRMVTCQRIDAAGVLRVNYAYSYRDGFPASGGKVEHFDRGKWS